MSRKRLFYWLLAGFLPAATAAADPLAATAEVPVLAQSVPKGAILAADDFVREARSTDRTRGAVALRDAIGMEAARNLPAGLVVRDGDLIRAQLVRRGEPVSIRIHSGSLTITATGRALGGGAVGDRVRVVSLATNRTLDGVVESAGTVGVEP